MRYLADHPQNQLMICTGTGAHIGWNGGPRDAPSCSWPTAINLRNKLLIERDPRIEERHWATYYRISALGRELLADREAFK